MPNRLIFKTIILLNEPHKIYRTKPNPTWYDAKESIQNDLRKMSKHVLPHQIQLRVNKEIITKTDEPIPNTIVIYAEIKEEEKEIEKKEEKKPKVNKECYLLEDQEKITYTPHVRARKPVPQIVADNYTCKRCEKKGDIMSNNVLKMEIEILIKEKEL